MNSDGKKILKLGLLIAFFVFIVLYAFFRSKDLIFGVKLRDISIEEGMVLSESTLSVTGNAKNALHLYLNGREISIDLEGDFQETIALISGYNVVEIKAEDKFGNKDEAVYKLIYSPPGLEAEQ